MGLFGRAAKAGACQGDFETYGEWTRSLSRLPMAHIIRNDGVGGSNPSCGTS